MIEPDHLLRALLTAEAFLALILAGHFLGGIWHHRAWPARLVLIGSAGILVYCLAGQVKAFNLGVPFDGFSLIGLAAYAVLLTGLVWHLAHERLDRSDW